MELPRWARRTLVHATALALFTRVASEPATARADEAVAGERPASGIGLLVAGSILTGLGVASLAAGPPLCFALTANAYDPSSERAPCVATELALGGVLVAVGVPLLLVGEGRYARYRRWREEHARYAFTLAPTAHGTAFGLGVSF